MNVQEKSSQKENTDTTYRRFMVWMVFLTFVGAVVMLISPILLNLWSSSQESMKPENIAILVLVLAASMVLQILLVIRKERYAKRFNIHNFQKYMDIFFHMKYDEIIKIGPTNLVERIQTAVNNVYEFMTGSNIQIWSSVFMLVVILGMVSVQNIPMALILLILIPVNYIGYKLLNKELARRSQVLQRETASGYQKIISFVGQTDYLKQCADHKILFRQMQPAMEQLYGSMMDINIYARGVSQVLSSVNEIAKVLVVVLAVYQFMSVEDNPFFVMMVVMLIPIYFSHISIITRANLDKQGMKAALKFVEDMESKREADGSLECGKIKRIAFSIDSLTVGDCTLKRMVNGICRTGNVVWVRGDSGSGKSTLVKLLPKFRETGGIKINGIELSKLKNESLRRRVYYMSQEVPIIKGTLRENLFFNREWSQEEEEKLRKETILEGLLERIGMDDMIEEYGANLSGGEKQKIAVARMLNEDVDVLILDEITSNVDKESAQKILDRIFECSEDKIVFIISHDNLPRKYATDELEIT